MPMYSRKEEKATYYKLNRIRILARSKAYDEAHKDTKRKYLSEWRARKRLKNLKPKTEISKKALFLDNIRFGGNRERAIQRDREVCRECKLTRKEHWIKYGKDITVHHINGKGRNARDKDHRLENLETLCLHCHGIKDNLRRL